MIDAKVGEFEVIVEGKSYPIVRRQGKSTRAILALYCADCRKPIIKTEDGTISACTCKP